MSIKKTRSHAELKITLAVLGASLGVVMVPVTTFANDTGATAESVPSGTLVMAAADTFLKIDDIKGEKTSADSWETHEIKVKTNSVAPGVNIDHKDSAPSTPETLTTPSNPASNKKNSAAPGETIFIKGMKNNQQ